MADPQTRGYARQYLSIYNNTGPYVHGCNYPAADVRQQQELDKFQTNPAPTVSSGKPTEAARQALAAMLGVQYEMGKVPSDFQIQQFEKLQSRLPNAPTKPPPTPTIKTLPGRRYSAYYSDGTSLQPIQIEQKKDQNFSKFATQWERSKSKLCAENNTYLPIVDGDFNVIGHYGHASGSDLQASSNVALPSTDMTDVLNRTQVFVVPPTYTDDDDVSRVSFQKKGYRTFRPTMEQYAVQCDIEGEVVNAQFMGTGNNGVAEPSAVSPLDLIDGAKLVLQIGLVIGAKIATRTIVKKIVARVGARIATREVARVAADEASILFREGWQEAMGIPKSHFPALAQAAKETESIAIFRANKSAAIPLIERGSPGKPKFFCSNRARRRGCSPHRHRKKSASCGNTVISWLRTMAWPANESCKAPRRSSKSCRLKMPIGR